MSDRGQNGKLARTLLRVPVPWVFVLTYLVGAGLEVAFHTGGFMLWNAGGIYTTPMLHGSAPPPLPSLTTPPI